MCTHFIVWSKILQGSVAINQNKRSKLCVLPKLPAAWKVSFTSCEEYIQACLDIYCFLWPFTHTQLHWSVSINQTPATTRWCCTEQRRKYLSWGEALYFSLSLARSLIPIMQVTQTHTHSQPPYSLLTVNPLLLFLTQRLNDKLL